MTHLIPKAQRKEQPIADFRLLDDEMELARRRFKRHESRFGEVLEADLLTWARYFLPEHFHLPPSKMHVWIAERLDEVRRVVAIQAQGPSQRWCPQPLGLAGLKLNVVGPRGSAKSTVTTLAFVLREALGGRQPYIWIVSDTKHQAAAHLDNVKAELLENRRLAQAYPQSAGLGPIWRRGAVVLRNGVMIEAFGTGQRIRGRRRRQYRPTLIVCDDLQNDGHIQSALAREHSRNWFHGLLMKAGTKRTSIVNLGTALHRQCLTMELHRTPGWLSRTFKAIERWPDHMPLWAAWEELYCDINLAPGSAGGLRCDSRFGQNAPAEPGAKAVAREFYERNRELMDAGVELLWPEEEDLYTLMCMRAESGSTAFEREKQSTPVNPDLCEWPEAYFGDWIWFEEWPGVMGSGERQMRSGEWGVGSAE